MHKKGFTIAEFCIYLVTLTIIAWGSSTWITILWGNFLKQCQKNRTYITLYSAHDSLMHDLHSLKEIIHVGPHEIIIQKKDIISGFLLEDNTLMRIQGNYNQKNNTWTKSIKNPLAKEINTFDCSHNNNHIKIHLVSKTCDIQSQCTLLQKEITWSN